MKPVCVASILELGNDFPNLHSDEHGDWISKWNKFLQPFNLEIIYFPFGAFPPPRGLAIMAVKSENFPGCTHSVVCQGQGNYDIKVMHDPSPLQHPAKYEEVGYHVFAVLDPSRMKR